MNQIVTEPGPLTFDEDILPNGLCDVVMQMKCMYMCPGK